MKSRFSTLVAVCLLALPALGADKKPEPEKKKELLSADTFEGLAFRGIGPSVVSGRVVDFAVVPGRPTLKTYYVAVASGGVWKTTNGGTTFSPIFDKEGSYSIGCLALDPKDPLTVWVGSGENNSQRSVSYGDGVYRSVDGGKTWENLGLKSSEHIGMIRIDPRDSRVVYVAAQGPLWKDGGDRGLYKTTDAGKSWKAILTISPMTGVSEVHLDPRNPDVLYASSYQRRRHVWTLINGGPESALHKSTDGGASWKKLEKGLPKADKGKIGLAISPAEPDTVYAVVEARDEKDRGFYRSTDAGASWERMGDQVSTSPQYYNEIFADPLDADRVYAMDTWMMVTEDAGKTWKKVGEKHKHVDNHALWIDPENTRHLLAGCDGGVYETFDRAATWQFKANLPITQFYRLALDNAVPYNVYGGTQDNNTVGGPSRTFTTHGATNGDWFVVVGGDGFQPRVDPEDPNIVYAEWQHGELVRFDRKTGERIHIQPQSGKGEAPLRWNWDSPLIISPHQRTRLYFGAQRLYRTDDRGDHWTPISDDLTQQIDRNKLKVMGRVWGAEAVAKNNSTSFYGNLVSLSESPKKEGLLYAGADDGQVSITEDGGKTWKKLTRFPGVPEFTYVADLEASAHDEGVVYAAFDNHQQGDFKPYLLRSADKGVTWVSIAGNLPERGTVYTVAEDPVRKELLFAGTEFGVFFTLDGGKKWLQLKGGLPTIAVRDIAIQARENDLVLATFGRGFYILDDYSALRGLTEAVLEKPSALLPVRKAGLFRPADPLGSRDQGSQGDSLYVAPNPPHGAVFTYYLKEELQTRKKRRLDEEKKQVEKSLDTPYPPWETLRAEGREEDPAVLVTISDTDGNAVRRLSGPVKKGFQRVAWDLRFPAANPIELKPEEVDPWDEPSRGPMAAPGTYKVSLATRVDGVVTPFGEETFRVEPLRVQQLTPEQRASLQQFQQRTARLQRAVLGAIEAGKEMQKRIDYLKKAVTETPRADAKLHAELMTLQNRLKDLQEELRGGSERSRYSEPEGPSIRERVSSVVDGHWSSTFSATGTHVKSYELAAEDFASALTRLQAIDKDLRTIEDRAEAAGAPWTPGRLPRWQKE